MLSTTTLALRNWNSRSVLTFGLGHLCKWKYVKFLDNWTYFGHIRLIPHRMTSSSSSSGSTIDKRDHLTNTANQQREEGIHQVTVKELHDISPTVKKVVLAPENSSAVQFRAGQWIDLFMPDDQVGGFSIVSSPTYLRKSGLVELAVKYSDWPSTFWIHRKCRVGSTLSMRVGGDFYFAPEDIRSLQNKTVLFIAGGVGINPLASMIFHIDDLKQETPGLNLRTVLLFSAKMTPELLFRDKFEHLAEKDDNFVLRFFLTGETLVQPSAKYSRVGRIKKADIIQALDGKEQSDVTNTATTAYICGPSPFIQNMENILQSLGVKQIFYENWWSGDAK